MLTFLLWLLLFVLCWPLALVALLLYPVVWLLLLPFRLLGLAVEGVFHHVVHDFRQDDLGPFAILVRQSLRRQDRDNVAKRATHVVRPAVNGHPKTGAVVDCGRKPERGRRGAPIGRLVRGRMRGPGNGARVGAVRSRPAGSPTPLHQAAELPLPHTSSADW